MEYSIVHLSDLHFKNDTENRFRLKKLLEDIKSLPLGGNIVTVFSGDLAQSGEAEQYDVLFELLLGPLIEADHQIAIVPGNHDIQRSLTDADLSESLLQDRASSYLFSGSAFVPSPYCDGQKNALENYRELEALFSPYDEMCHYGYLKQFGDLAIVGMNSTWLSHEWKDGSSDRGRMRVEPYVLQQYAEKLPEGGYKVLVMHHPFDWLEENTRDAVTTLATKHFDLVLFGHVHTADTSSLVKNNAGAAFVQSPPLRADWSKGTNGYSVIRCDTKAGAAEITYRSFSKSRREFVLGEDFGAGGVTYPSSTDECHFKHSPSLSSLAQKFLSGVPHDFVDWHRKNLRAKSSNIESFVVPNIQRVMYSDDEQWLEAPVPLTDTFEGGAKDQFVIAPADSGLSTCAFLTLKGIAEAVPNTGLIPVFFDAGESKVNKASILRSMTQSCLVNYSTAEVEHLAAEGSVRLIVDGLNLSNADRFNTFRDVMSRYFPKVRYIAFVRTEKVGQSISGENSPNLSLVEDEVFELGELRIEQIREVISMHRKKFDEPTASKLASHAVESLAQINEPVFPSTVAVLVETLVQDHEFRPVNKARLLDRYVECLLGRFELEDVREGTFTSHNKIEFLSYVARTLLENDKPGFTDKEWQELVGHYECNYLIELPNDLLEEFEEKGLLVGDNGQITFRADYLFSYFVARQMKSDGSFASKIIGDDGLYRHHSEIKYYAELEGTDTSAVLDQLYDQIDRLEETLLEQYSQQGIDLTTEWQRASEENADEVIEIFSELQAIEAQNPDPKIADFQDNQRLANVLRRRGIARRHDVAEVEARLLVAMKLYGHLIRNALHIPGSDKLRHLRKLYAAAETWVGFMSACRVHIGSSPVTVAGGVRFINYGAIINQKRSIDEFKFNAPNSVSKILAEAVRNPQLSVALRNVLPTLEPMGALFAREALLGLPSQSNRDAYLESVTQTDDPTLLRASLRILKREYLGSGRNSDMQAHSSKIVEGIQKSVGENAMGNPNKLKQQKMLRDMKENAATRRGQD